MNTLSPEDLVLVIIEAAGGSIGGKTLVQKRAYFLSSHLGMECGFRAHYYGPYSPVIDHALGRLKSLGFLSEQTEGFGRRDSVGFEWRKYHYILTADGRKLLDSIKRTAQNEVAVCHRYLKLMSEAGDSGDYVSLSIAAKTAFILEKERKAMTIAEISDTAKQFNWDVKEEAIEDAAEFLGGMGLVRNK